MMKILQINSSARIDGSHSTRLANSIVERLRAAQADTTLTVRNLSSTPHPELGEAALHALFTAAELRTPEQAALGGRRDGPARGRVARAPAHGKAAHRAWR